VTSAGLPFESISTGKLRRYFSLENVVDFFRIPLGVVQAFFKLGRLKPNVVFSKGGFVGFPVVLAAWLRRIPVVIHDSDAIPGLATKLSAPFASKIVLAYETSRMELNRYEDKIEMMGNPVRLSLFEGSAQRAKKATGFTGERPVLLVMGGSSGSQEINTLVEHEKKSWTEHFDVVHVSGHAGHAGAKTKALIKKEPHYFELAFVDKGMNDLYALASLALTRAGANTLAELHALQIPALLYPLGTHASRGDQVANAKVMALESPLFVVANAGRPALAQLLALPTAADAAASASSTNTATEKIAWLLLSYAKP